MNAVVKAYVDQLFEMKMSYSRYAIEWMTGKAREEGARLEQAERNLQAFMKANDILAHGEPRAGVPPSGSRSSALELTKAETRRRELEAVYKRLAAVADDPAAAETIAAVERRRRLRRREGPAAQGRAEPGRALAEVRPQAPGHGRRPPGGRDARAQAKAAEVRRIVLSAKNEMELAAAREEDLRRRLSSGRSDAVAANEKFVRYEELKRAVETNRQFYDTLMARAKEESLTQQLQGVQVWTLEPATVPEAPDGPRTARTVLLGLLLGLGRAPSAWRSSSSTSTTPCARPRTSSSRPACRSSA